VTILDTDVPGGAGVGLVAMIEVVALMIGAIDQCYSEMRYDHPSPIVAGMFLRKGRPKSLYRPGSSTTIVVFQAGRIAFASDLVRNMSRADVHSRFSRGFGKPLVETDVRVRSTIGTAIPTATRMTARERDAHGQ
jgi:phosphatidylserine decarboxylase